MPRVLQSCSLRETARGARSGRSSNLRATLRTEPLRPELPALGPAELPALDPLRVFSGAGPAPPRPVPCPRSAWRARWGAGASCASASGRLDLSPQAVELPPIPRGSAVGSVPGALLRVAQAAALVPLALVGFLLHATSVGPYLSIVNGCRLQTETLPVCRLVRRRPPPGATASTHLLPAT